MFDYFYISFSREWSTFSMVFYELLALLGFLCFYYGRKQQSINNKLVDKPLKTPAYLVWIFVWTFFATFRHVSFGFGGADAPSYIMFFENCNSSFYNSWMEHAGDDLFFKYFNKFIRYFFDDYRFYFAIIYSIMTSIMVYFIDYFCPKTKFTAIPAILIFHIYLRGYTSIRSNFSFCLLLLAIIMLSKKKYRWMIFFAIASILTHKSMILFAGFIPFYFVFTRYFKLNIKYSVALLVFFSLISVFIRDYISSFLGAADFEGSYESYVNKSVGSSFLDNYWKIAFEQMFLGIVLFFCNSSYTRYVCSFDEGTRHRIDLIWMLCIYDLLLIPVCYVLGIWRAPEFFHMARTCMWCILLGNLFYYKNWSLISKFLLIIIFMAWIYNRVDRTWDSSCLMPYLFSPFIY